MSLGPILAKLIGEPETDDDDTSLLHDWATDCIFHRGNVRTFTSPIIMRILMQQVIVKRYHLKTELHAARPRTNRKAG